MKSFTVIFLNSKQFSDLEISDKYNDNLKFQNFEKRLRFKL